MKLLFKQRMFSWFDSYDIYNEAGDAVYEVKGVLSWGHCLKIFGPDGAELGTVKEEVFSFLPRFALYVGGECVGQIKKNSRFSSPCLRWTAAAGASRAICGNGITLSAMRTAAR